MPAEPSHFPYHHAVLEYFQSHESVRWQAFHDGTEVSDRESRQLLQLRNLLVVAAPQTQLINGRPIPFE